MMAMLGYIPFLHPMSFVHEWWYLLIVPLSFGIAVIYKAVRLTSLRHYWRSVLVMTAQIVLAMVGLAVAVILVVMAIPYLHYE